MTWQMRQPKYTSLSIETPGKLRPCEVTEPQLELNRSLQNPALVLVH